MIYCHFLLYPSFLKEGKGREGKEGVGNYIIVCNEKLKIVKLIQKGNNLDHPINNKTLVFNLGNVPLIIIVKYNKKTINKFNPPKKKNITK